MKTIKHICLLAIIIIITSCAKKQELIPIDEKITSAGTSENAKKVIDFAESKLSGIKSLHTTWISTKDSDMYGHEKIYKGDLIVEFSGKPGGLENRYYSTKQSAKGVNSNVQGVITKKGLKELHLLRKKAVSGGVKAYSAASIAYNYNHYMGDKNFYNRWRDFSSDSLHSWGGKFKRNVHLEKIENIYGIKCYVLKSINPDRDILVERVYFGVEDGMYYGKSIEVNGKDGKQISKDLITKLEINKSLPEFDVEVPEDFTVEIYTSPVDRKSMTVGMQAHDWTLESSTNEEITLSEVYKKDIVLLDFWATWCGPCKIKMPFIQKMHEKYKDKGLKVISVLSGDVGHEKAAADYIKKYKYTFELVFGTNEMSNKYKIRFLPTVLMVDKTGKIIFYRDTVGANDGIDEKVELENAIKKALYI